MTAFEHDRCEQPTIARTEPPTPPSESVVNHFVATATARR